MRVGDQNLGGIINPFSPKILMCSAFELDALKANEGALVQIPSRAKNPVRSA